MTEMANAYLDRDLSWSAKAQFRLHLMMCKHCRRYVDQLAKTVTLLRQAPAEAPDRGTEDKLAELFRNADRPRL
ncbi:anti-sigma factor family protein [Ferrovibrio xuzhouensis]|uniref:Anti-sigma factor family protein n=1 Tax=Ferrovibrio xuzhouensis TaxID=1576914 RepID=A0ABV7VHZ9_9PROT